MNSVKKVLSVAAIAVSAICAASGDDPTIQCNENNATYPGMEKTSCTVTVTNAGLIFDPGITFGDGPKFYIETKQKMFFNGDTLPLRLYTYEASAGYKDMEAILQTAYSTRSTIYVGYPNPRQDTTVNLKRIAKNTYTVGGHTYNLDSTVVIDLLKHCFTNTGLNDSMAFVHCPIQTLEILH